VLRRAIKALQPEVLGLAPTRADPCTTCTGTWHARIYTHTHSRGEKHWLTLGDVARQLGLRLAGGGGRLGLGLRVGPPKRPAASVLGCTQQLQAQTELLIDA
jgi:hypothetical protein